MSWLGTGAPSFIVNGVTHDFPRPVAGGREDMFKIAVHEEWETIDGHLLEGDMKWRVEDRLTWANLSSTQIELLCTWLSQRRQVLYRPHSDRTDAYLCRLVDKDNPKDVVTAANEEFSIELRSINLIDALPAPQTGIVVSRNMGIV